MKLNILVLLASATVALGAISRDGNCGGSKGQTCLNSSFGNCCSQHGYCGSSIAYCGTGCQSKFGTCNKPASPSAAPSLKISVNGKCGSGITCQGSVFGDCCSQHGYCGNSAAYCGKGCNPLFGKCSGSQPPATSSRIQSSATQTASSSAAASATGSVSTNARCGHAYEASPGGMTCMGSKFGNCCSQYSYCGSTEAYCGTGCQDKFGNCNAKPSSSSIISSSSSSSSSSTTSSSSSSSEEVLTSTSSSTEELRTSTSSSTEELPTSTSSSTEGLPTSTSSSTEELPASTSSSESSTSASSTSSEIASSTTSEPAAPIITNYVTDGSFEDAGSGSSPWGFWYDSDQAWVTFNTAIPGLPGPDTGKLFVAVDANWNKPTELWQSLVGLKAGTKVSCSGRYTVNGIIPLSSSVMDQPAASVKLQVDGQLCGYGRSESNHGWIDIPATNTVTLSRDDAEFRVVIIPDTQNGNLQIGVDTVGVFPVSA